MEWAQAETALIFLALRQIKPRLSKLHNLTLALARWPRQPLSLGQSGAAPSKRCIKAASGSIAFAPDQRSCQLLMISVQPRSRVWARRKLTLGNQSDA
jgi:hypothetical protein